MKRSEIFILFILISVTACRSPWQAVALPLPPETVTVTVTDTIMVQVPVPTWQNEGTASLPDSGLVDSLWFDLPDSQVEVVMVRDTVYRVRRYRVLVNSKPDTMSLTVVERDTVRVACPQVLPVSGDGFPWGVLLALIASVIMWLVSRKKKKDIS